MEHAVSPEEALNGFRLSLKNGESLIEEAKVLLHAGHNARSLALAILAVEELAKLPRYAAVSRYAAEGRWKQWWKYFRSHKEKLNMHHILARFWSPDDLGDDEMRDLVEGRAGGEFDMLKQAALYVDFYNGEFVSPLELPRSRELAEATIAYAESMLPVHRFIAENVTAANLEKAGRVMVALRQRASREGRSVMDVLAEDMVQLVKQMSED